jgi:exodeoxyribonuclease V alpha subunit
MNVKKTNISLECNFLEYNYLDNKRNIFFFTVTSGKRYYKIFTNKKVSFSSKNEKLIIYGFEKESTKYGKYISATSIIENTPSTDSSFKKFLTSKYVSGIGEKTSEKLINKFGEKLYDIFLNRRWSELKNSNSISKSICEKLIQSWEKTSAYFNLHIAMYKHGLSHSSVKKIFKIYGLNSMEIVKNNPYVLMENAGIAFKIADKIACEILVQRNDSRRIKAAIITTIDSQKENGNTYIEKNELEKQTIELCKNEITKDDFSKCINQMINDKIITIESHNSENLVFIFHDIFCEKYIKQKIQQIQSNKISNNIENIEFESILNNQQKEAIKGAIENNIYIITGCAGTGKTTVLKNLFKTVEKNKITSTFCAPTGRAAQRIMEAVGCKAKTIHSLIGYKRILAASKYKISEYPIVNTNFLIIDETSMIDIYMMHAILSSISTHTKILFVGDYNQLPSINCGNLLHDFIKQKMIKFTNLTEIFRQHSQNKIISTSKAISNGIIPRITSEINSECSFLIYKEKLLVISKIKSLLIKSYDSNKHEFKIQILTPMNRGVLGTQNINREVQLAHSKIINIDVKFMYFNLYDKVIQTKNNYKLEVFNGDIGKIIDIQRKILLVQFFDKVVEYDEYNCSELSLAYAITTHKSQGSEFDTICIPLLMEHYINLNRNSLYTAITRAKKKCIIIGDYKAMACAVKKNDIITRKTYLSLS